MTELLPFAEPATADAQTRTISGRIVPFGPPGRTGLGVITFAAGSISWSDPKRVKLLREHNQVDVVGYGQTIEERADGIYATFAVPQTPAGDLALAEAAHSLRDGLSVGIAPDAETLRALRASGGKPTAARGQLRETSLVSVPAFDDARVDQVAASSSNTLVVSTWGTTTDPSQEDNPMTETAVETAPAALATATAAPATETTGPVNSPPSQAGPVPVQAAFGAAAIVTSEPSTYTFSGNDGHSIVQDAYRSQMEGDREAGDRIARFNAELADGNMPSVLALCSVSSELITAAVETRSSVSEIVNPSVRRPDLMVNAINTGRPVWSRLNPVRITNAQPQLLPIEGEFDGVAAHTEGTAHATEGTFTADEITATPRAVSGAKRISRELADSSSPAADTLIVRAMIRDYQRKTEAYAMAQLLTGLTAVTGINTVAELRAQLLDFDDDNDYPADFVFASGTFLTALINEVDGDGRPMLPVVGPSNAVGTVRSGYMATVDDVELVKGRKAMTAGDAAIVAVDGVLAGESGVQQFRFEQPEGPGIIKLALWGYQLVKVTRAGAVRKLTLA